jgi:hypothetical protein
MSKSKSKRTKPTAGADDSTRQHKDLEEQMLDKLPPETTQAQEWGERYKTSEAIANRGKAETDSSPKPVEEDS